MKESAFIKQNKKKWVEFEENLKKKELSPQETAKLFVQITEDLSYARTFYKNRSVRVYLNGVAKVLFNEINKSNKIKAGHFIRFWQKDLPLVMYRARRAMLISGILFFMCALLGMISSMYDPDFSKEILGSGYIEMTNENIAKGKPMDVYASSGEVETFLYIMYNNLRVAFRTFFSGIFMSIGTLLIMIYNGVMVGAFQYFFIEKGLFWESFLSIWTHGTIEISCIIIAGGAGLTLGQGLLFPGTYSRFQAFRMSGMRGLKIMMGISPLIILAAFIEGFLTRHTEFPDVIRFAFILLSLAFMLIYFFWYPRKVAKQTKHTDEDAYSQPIKANDFSFDTSKILSAQKIFASSLWLFFKQFPFFLTVIFLSITPFSIFIITDEIALFYDSQKYYYTYFNVFDLFNYREHPSLAVLNGVQHFIVCIICLLYTRHRLFHHHARFNIINTFDRHTFFSVLFSLSLFTSLLLIGNVLLSVLTLLLLPSLILISAISSIEGISFFRAVNKVGQMLNRNWEKLIGPGLIILVISAFITIANTLISEAILTESLILSLADDVETARSIRLMVSAFLSSANFIIYLVMVCIFSCILFFTLKESYTAEKLIQRINNIRIKT